MKQPWEVFSTVLSVMLIVALVIAGVTTAMHMWSLTSADAGSAELSAWAGGVAADAGRAGGTATADADGGKTAILGNDAARLARDAMIAFALIPFVTYLVTVVSYLRHRRWAYVVMAAVQIGVLLAVAIPVLAAI